MHGTLNHPSFPPDGSYDRVTDAEILAEVEVVLASPEFRSSERASDFLRHIVEEELAGRGERIKAYSIAVNLLGKPADFNPLLDPIVRIQAGRLRKALELYYLVEGRGDLIRIELPKGGYRPHFTRVSHPAQSPSTFPLPSETPDPKPSLVILPFQSLVEKNGPAEKDSRYSTFAQGVTIQLAAALSPFEWLRVFLGNEDGSARGVYAPEEAWAAKSSFVLAGTIDQTGDGLAATVTLQDAQTRQVLWSDTCTHLATEESLLHTEQRFAHRLAGMLADVAGVIPRSIVKTCMEKPPEVMPLYEAAFCYMDTVIRSRDDYLRARSVLEHALARYPNHAFANTVLAQSAIHDFNYCFDVLDHPLDTALDLARRAVALEPMSQMSELFLAYTYFQRREFEQFRTHAERAVELNPNCSYCVCSVGMCTMQMGNWEDGLPMVRRGMELNPYYVRFFHLGPYLHHFAQGDYEAALRESRLFNVPGFFWSPLVQAAALGRLGQTAQARAALDELLALRADFPAKARELISRSVLLEELAEDMLRGLRAAGLRA